MVRTRSQLENLSKDELIDEVLSLENFKNDINAKFSELNYRFNDSQAKYEMVNSNLSISRRCTELLPFFYFFFNWYSLHARLNSHYEAWSYKEKKQKKVKAYRKSL